MGFLLEPAIKRMKIKVRLPRVHFNWRLFMLIAGVCLFLLNTLHAHAQDDAPKIDGVVSSNEYGSNLEGENARTSGGAQWQMSWDDNNLYLSIIGSNPIHGAVIYLDIDPPDTPDASSYSKSKGLSAGVAYDNTNLARLPFKADFVAYFKNEYREYRRTDKSGATWSAPNTSFGAYASAYGTSREIAIPWSVITGSRKPAAFSFLGYITTGDGFVYAQLPPENGSGKIGVAAVLTHYYSVKSTAKTASSRPFALALETTEKRAGQ